MRLFIACHLFSLIIVSNLKAQESAFKENSDFDLILEYRSAFGFDDSGFQKNEFILKPSFYYKFSKKLRLHIEGRLYSELNDNLEHGKPDQDAISDFSKRWFIGDRTELELREVYFDWYVGKRSTIRIGKQQIVWGETDGLKLLDVVNPQSFREFILDDFEDSRIPLWSVKAEFPLTQSIDAELIWIPDQTYHFIPLPDAPYFPSAVVPSAPEGVSTEFQPLSKPDHFIEDSEIGFRLSTFAGGWDMTFSYLYHYDDLANFYLNLDLTDEPSLIVRQQFERIHLLGATFNKALGSFVLRGETALNLNRHFSTSDVTDHQGVKQSDQILNTVGLDWVSGEWILSAQLFNDYLFGEIDPFNRGDLETNWTFLTSHELMNDNLKLEVLAIHNINRGDWLLRPNASYFLTSSLEIDLGIDVFGGDEAGLLGQFGDRSRIYLNFQLGL